TGLAVDDHGDGHDLGTFSAQYLDGLQRRLPRGGGVFENHDALARDVGAFDLPAAPVVLRLFADDESVQRALAVDRGVQHGVGDRIGAEREPADGYRT